MRRIGLIIAVLAAFLGTAQAADSTYGGLTAVTTPLAGTELWAVEQAGSGKKVTFAQANAFVNTLPKTVVSATSGGIPCFTSTTAEASSGLLAANALMIGGGAGVCPSTTTTGTGVVTAVGSNVNTNGGLLTASTAAIAANAIVTGAGSGTALTGTTPGTGVLTALGTAVNTNGGPVTASTASIASGAILTGGGSGTAISGITPGTGVATALAANVSAAADVQAGTSGAKLVVPSAISGSASPQTLTDGATVSWDVASGYNAKLTLTASGHTLANPTNVTLGYTYIVVISAATYTMSFGTAYDFGDAGTPTLTASKDNVIACYANGTSGANSLYCNAMTGF